MAHAKPMDSEPIKDLPADSPSKSRTSLWKRIAVAALVVVALIGLYYGLGLDKYADAYVFFSTLNDHRETVLAWVDANIVLAVAGYIIAYAFVVALSLPVASFLTVAAGFVFGFILAPFYTVLAATLGATGIFIVARYFLGSYFLKRAGSVVKRMEKGFKDDAVSYLLVLRLIPIFPFWLVNIAPAFTRVRLWTYIWTTFVGIIPGTAVYAWLGNGLGVILDRGETPDLEIIFEPQIIIPLVGLAVLALLPVGYKKFVARDKRA